MKFAFIDKFEDLIVEARVLILFKDYDESMIPESVKGKLKVLKERGTFEFGKAQIRRFCLDGSPFYIASVGVEADKATAEDLRFTAYKLFLEVKKERFEEISVMLPKSAISKPHAYSLIAEMAANIQYSFDWYKSKRKENLFKKLNFVGEKETEALKAAVSDGFIKSEAVKVARRLVDEPANIMTPQELADQAKEIGKKYGIEVEVLEKDKIEKLGMHAFLTVARGSNNQPKLIVMRYNGNGKKGKVHGIVGKGLMYDSGGYSLKPNDGMKDMKNDMGGAAAVISSMQAIAEAKLAVNVVCVVAACQNLIGPDAYFPGDIISSMAGKSIYIGNTDAEGRLTLADALTYIIDKEKVDTVFDFATLTGAAVRAFGNACAAAVSNDDELYSDYEKAADSAGEKVWRLPTFREYDSLIEHHEADLTNSAGTPGCITAALFLREFVGETPWVHVDIAPIAHLEKQFGYYDRGATGYAVKTIYEYMKLKSN